MSSSSGGGGGGPMEPPLDNIADQTAHQQHQQQQQQQQQQTSQRFSSFIHDSEVFLTKLREFKPQSLGCLEARRKSSSTLIFPSPQQACMGPPKCPRYPHNVKPTPGYWIECHGPGIVLPGSKPTMAATPGSSSTVAATAASSASQGCSLLAGHHQQEHASSVSLGNSKSASQDEMAPGSQRGASFRSNLFTTTTTTPNTGEQSSRLGTATPQHQHHIPTTPTADRIITRHDKDLVSDRQQQVEADDIGTRRQSVDQLESPSSSALDQQQRQSGDLRENIPSSQERTPTLNSRSDDQQLADSSRNRSSIKSKSAARKAAESAQAKSTSSELRKKLNKRTMTRDDIDLHKTRRGTPNITITEPSFNQSTRGASEMMRQWSQSGAGCELRRLDSVDSTPAPTPCKPIKFHIQRCISVDKEGQSGAPGDQQGAPEGDLAEQKLISGSFERQDSSETEDFLFEASGAGCGQQAQLRGSYEPYRPQHRPSIIREDIDNESGSDVTHERKEFYCGLSTTTFNKKSYQQVNQELQQQQLQQQQQHSASPNLEQFRDSSLELISFEEENYEKHYYGREHWNYFTNDELLGPVMLSLKQEVNNQRDHFHVLLRTVSYTLHGTIPASTICADRYDREAIVRELSEIAKLKPPLMLGQLPSTPDELLKLDHIFIKTELKVGVIYIKSGQAESEEAILSNREESPLFTEFLDLIGDRIVLKGFDRYKGGLDTVHNLTGTESVYTMWRNIEIMFHVSTMLPHEENDPQKLQKKRHIGNDIVCVAFIESDDTLFWPGCIKSYFLHTFIAVQTSPRPLKEGEKRKYSVSCVCRNEVQYAFRPYLVEQDEFYKSDYFREWLLVKIVNGERASYSAPKFARMQDRTRSQLLEDITTSLANHLVTGQIPKPYRRGSWRPLGHTRASSPLEDSMKDYFEDYDQLAKDFCNAFCGPSRSMLCDVVFRVKDSDGSFKLVHGVRAIMAIRSRTFLEMLYGFVPPGTGPSSLQNQTNLRAIEMKALSGESSSTGAKDSEQTKSLLAKRGSVGADSNRKIGEKERRQSMLPNLSKSVSQKPNYLTVPSSGGGGGGGSGGGGVSGTSGTSGMIKNAFNRLVSGNWSGWSGNIKGYKGEPMHIKVDQNKTKVDLNSLAICKEIAKIDADKLAQREFEIKEFDYETFQQTIEYIHNGQCKLSYETIPGLICAAEHYDLPDLLHACFHHANTHMRLNAAPKMMNSLYQNSCFYITAMQLLDSIYEYIDPHGNEFFSRSEYLELYESVFTTLLSRKSLQIGELKKFQAMNDWARHQVALKQQQRQQQQQHQLESRMSLDTERQTDVEQQPPPPPLPPPPQPQQANTAEAEATEYRNLMVRLSKEVNIKLDKISNEDLVRIVLPAKVFSNDKIFEVMSEESRNDY